MDMGIGIVTDLVSLPKQNIRIRSTVKALESETNKFHVLKNLYIKYRFISS